MTIIYGDSTDATVSRETPSERSEGTIYERLVEWSVWATDRLEIIDWQDNIVPHSPVTAERRAELAKIRRQDLTPRMQAVERAVGRLRIHDSVLHKAVCLYFVHTRTVSNIATLMHCGEDHVISYLRRGLRYLAVEVPRQEAWLR